MTAEEVVDKLLADWNEQRERYMKRLASGEGLGVPHEHGLLVGKKRQLDDVVGYLEDLRTQVIND